MDIYRDKRVLKWQGGGKRVIRFQSFSYCSAGIKNNTRGVFLGKGRSGYVYLYIIIKRREGSALFIFMLM